ncbi:hypothetical protein HYDPIDRAFT_33310 [Hydnomerulius pinastri MD-312]|uniref:Polyketide synthase-like phosphopantetheine-binding domain-containing protein n=1 Tax=Hydnomerulius pinastri MD-312 TaxID=994086 RepID=A0A0C9W928_9AGAM|nr:hypothetical protein HYDPIDRAFT_33310 [Hydnomerulius pinastri MD-312]
MVSTISNTPVFAPLDCSLLLSDLINFNMEKNASISIYVYANDNIPGSTTDITFFEFGRAAHRVAHALRPARQGKEGQVVMLIANTDTLLHHAVVAGMSIAGLVPFLVSPRNSAAAIVSMMRQTNCSRIVTVRHAHQSLIDDICRETEDIQLVVDELPILAYAFPKLGREIAFDPFVAYPPSTSRPDLDSPAIYLHSSGSTGFPKPIPHSHRVQIQWMAKPSIYGYCNIPAPRRMGVMSLPPFHLYGINMQLYVPIACLVSAVLYPPRSESDPHARPTIPTTDNILDCVRKTKSKILMIIPAFLEQMATSKSAVYQLLQLDLVAFGGGPLSMKVGDALCAAGVPLVTGYGATECGIITLIPSPEDIANRDWLWLRFPEEIKVRWAPQGNDVYECQVLATEGYPVAVENLADIKGYASSDLFIKHPTKDMWRIIGRKDDVIVLVSGEKTVPAPMENLIGSSPLIMGAVMFGRQRNQVGILIEPRPEYAVDTQDEKAVSEFRNQIWPLVEEANKAAPTFSRIFKEMILITSSEKPMARTGKGTVQKKATLKDYESEIDILYNVVEASSRSPSGSVGPSAWTKQALEEWLTAQACAINSGRSIDSDADLFAQGFDSLSVTHLRNQLLGALRDSSDPEARNAASQVPANLIFENPTVKLLAARISALVDHDDTPTPQAMDLVEQRKAAMNAMIEKYSVGLRGPPNGVLANGIIGRGTEPVVVLLTGSTGGLGSFLLAQLLESECVHRVYALNRPSTSASTEERQRSAFLDKDLSVDLLISRKLVYVEADASQDRCGLSLELYDELRDSVTVIIHNAWRLDFNLSLGSFESSIRATRNLVDLGLDSPHRQNVRFLFTSSISSARSWDHTRGPFPEEVQLDPSVAVGAGYGESKYVSEGIIVKSGLHATSLRIGQIAGGPNGCWATTDWLPIIIKSSVVLGALPEAYGVVSWMRTEDVASAILEIAFAKDALPPTLNIVNPRGAPWVDVMGSVRDSMIRQKSLKSNDLPTIPLEAWFNRLEQRAEGASAQDLVNIPAIKLLDTFRAMARSDQTSRRTQPATVEACGMGNFSTSKAQLVSQTMAQMQPVGKTEARSWVQYWCSKGAF